MEAHLFSESIDKFKALHATVIGVTAGKLDELADFSKETEHCGGKFPVAADKGAKIAKEYDATLLMRPGWSDRTSYVIAPSGKITHVYSSLSPKKPRAGNARRSEGTREVGPTAAEAAPRRSAHTARCGPGHDPVRDDRAATRTCGRLLRLVRMRFRPGKDISEGCYPNLGAMPGKPRDELW